MNTSENIPIQETLAREFELWQKRYYDDVYDFFQKRDRERLLTAFNSWEQRFLEFLREKLPKLGESYENQTAPNIPLGYAGDPLQTFKHSKSNAIESFLAQCIEDARKGYLNKDYLEQRDLNSQTSTITSGKESIVLIDETKAIGMKRNTEFTPAVFVSHSSNDLKLAKLIVELLSSSLGLKHEDIRCTSVPGYRLPGGADFEKQLRSEIISAEAVIGLISKKSFNSAYVLFELGARWGTGRTLIPLLVDMNPKILKGPIVNYNVLSCKKRDDLKQFVFDVANRLGLEPRNQNANQGKINKIISVAANTKKKSPRSIRKHKLLRSAR